MSKIKLIVEIEKRTYELLKDKPDNIAESIIANGTPYNPSEAIDFKEEIIRMVNMGVYPEAIVEWVRESEAEND